MIKIIMIGAYGFDEQGFFEALQSAGVQVFVDIRWRRGVRGADYAFVNSERLQTRLASLGIAYLHRRDLAPTPDIRQRQQQADQQSKTAKRQRNTLGEAFVQAYRAQILASFDPQAFLDDLPAANVIALFCVEGEPAACHRSLLADRLRWAEEEVEVIHLRPGD